MERPPRKLKYLEIQNFDMEDGIQKHLPGLTQRLPDFELVFGNNQTRKLPRAERLIRAESVYDWE